jgi:hypothetical protein
MTVAQIRTRSRERAFMLNKPQATDVCQDQHGCNIDQKRKQHLFLCLANRKLRIFDKIGMAVA